MQNSVSALHGAVPDDRCLVLAIAGCEDAFRCTWKRMLFHFFRGFVECDHVLDEPSNAGKIQAG
jgi:hypothetical protein